MPRLTVEVINQDNEPIIIDWHNSKVKVRGGTYKKLSNSENIDTILPGKNASIVFNTTFGANAKRRYQISVNNGDSTKLVYHPGQNDWTENPTPTIKVKV